MELESTDNEIGMNDQDEYNALTKVLHAHCNYGNWAIKEIIHPKRLKFDSLDNEEQQLLHWFPEYLQQLEHSIKLNSDFFTCVANTMAPQWGAGAPHTWCKGTYQDLNKVRGLMSQYVREWSSDGANEREESFGRILSMSEKLFPDVINRQNLEVLVPGAGLGRLVVEFVKRGFRTQGNEVSYHMLLNSNFILNNSFFENNFVICPFIHKSSNSAKRNYQCRQIYFPDFNPGDISLINIDYPSIPVADLMSMVAGGFVDLYGPPNKNKITDSYPYFNDEDTAKFQTENEGKFDLVSTCYFLDTATNIIDYLKAIHHCLKDDGYWINFGPFLWHFESDDNIHNVKRKDKHGNVLNVPTPMRGLELSRDDLIELIKNIGFDFIERESDIDSTYGNDIRSLGNWNYKCEFWVCKKKKN